MAGEVNLDVALDRARYPVMDNVQLAYTLLEVQPAATDAVQPTSAALNLALVLDRSGSMAGEKIAKLKEAARLTVDRLGPEDFVSIVIFDEEADVVAASQPAANKEALYAQLEMIQERGGTKISSGMAAGLEQLQAIRRAETGAPQRVAGLVLLTDGETWEDEPDCRRLAEEAARRGIPITALGLGEDWNQNLLTDLASLSGGYWDYIDEPEKIKEAFQHVVTTMQGTVVTNATLILRLIPGAQPRQVWRVTPLISPLGQRALSERDVQVSLGDLQQSGQSVLVELMFPPRQQGAYRLAQAEVIYDLPGSGIQGARAQRDIVVTFSGDAMTAQQRNARVMNIVEKVTAHKLMTRALDESEMVDAAVRTQRLRAAATRLLDVGEADLAREAEEAASQLESGEQLSPRATKKLVSKTQKLDMSDLLGS